MKTACLCLLAATCGGPALAFVPVPTARFAGTTAALTRAQRPASFSPLRMAAGGDDGKKLGPWEAFTTDFATKFAVAATIAAVTFAAPGDALAARSGGRMGGRSFSAPSVSVFCVCQVRVLGPYMKKGSSRCCRLHGVLSYLFFDNMMHGCGHHFAARTLFPVTAIKTPV